jgi:hypothetical protein
MKCTWVENPPPVAERVVTAGTPPSSRTILDLTARRRHRPGLAIAGLVAYAISHRHPRKSRRRRPRRSSAGGGQARTASAGNAPPPPFQAHAPPRPWRRRPLPLCGRHPRCSATCRVSRLRARRSQGHRRLPRSRATRRATSPVGTARAGLPSASTSRISDADDAIGRQRPRHPRRDRSEMEPAGSGHTPTPMPHRITRTGTGDWGLVVPGPSPQSPYNPVWRNARRLRGCSRAVHEGVYINYRPDSSSTIAANPHLVDLRLRPRRGRRRRCRSTPIASSIPRRAWRCSNGSPPTARSRLSAPAAPCGQQPGLGRAARADAPPRITRRASRRWSATSASARSFDDETRDIYHQPLQAEKMAALWPDRPASPTS